MKIIDLLNKIANGEIDESTIIEFDNGYNDYCSVRVFFDRYIMDKENLNLKIKLKQDNNKIEKLKRITKCIGTDEEGTYYTNEYTIPELAVKIDEIIDKINDK